MPLPDNIQTLIFLGVVLLLAIMIPWVTYKRPPLRPKPKHRRQSAKTKSRS